MPSTLLDLLKERANPAQSARLLLFPLGNTISPRKITYKDLYEKARCLSSVILCLEHFTVGRPVLLHFNDHWDTILWFWTVLLAGGLPVLSSPFSNLEHQRHSHIQHLSNLLSSPICLTRSHILASFGNSHNMNLQPIERLLKSSNALSVHPRSGTDVERCTSSSSDAEQANSTKCSHNYSVNVTETSWVGKIAENGGLQGNNTHNAQDGTGLAMLMLTSGSTGAAKAVQFTHRQILHAISSKAAVRPLPRNRPFLNWIGLDHVAALIEIHLQALWLGVDQVHVCSADILTSPKIFLDLLSLYRICRTFAPNFFLAKLVSAAESANGEWDFSSLTYVASGGEANDVGTCVAVQRLLSRHGAPDNVIVTGFGMTETCAGAIFNLSCPDHDIAQGRLLASVGQCMSGIEMRISSRRGLARPDEPGDLEVRGPIVFKGYYRDPVATKNAFTPDQWFITGDRAVIDQSGNLTLVGRTKDIININGIKMIAADIQTALEQALGNRVSRLIVFASRAMQTEQVTVAYIPIKFPESVESVVEISRLLTRECLLCTSTRPLIFALQEHSLSLLPVSTLGKISRLRMASLFDDRAFAKDVELYQEAITLEPKSLSKDETMVASKTETVLIEDFAKTLDKAPGTLDVSPQTCIFEMGFTSMHVIKLKYHLEKRLGYPVPIILIMRNSTARSMTAALHRCGNPGQEIPRELLVDDYDPVVVFRATGSNAPLWLIHPGVGEVLVFVELAKYLAADNRPIFALRAAGFEPGQQHFNSIEQAVDTYTRAIRKHQPRGPYALAGYSYGAMLAFEVAKRLGRDHDGDEVRFLGSFNLPPHIKGRVSQLGWNACLLHLAHFLGLVSEDVADALECDKYFCELTREKALRYTLNLSHAPRLSELGLEIDALARWTNVAFGLQRMAAHYDPSGRVDSIDVFHAIPLRAAARSRDEWLNRQLSLWADFAREPPRFHAVEGAHYTMIAPENVGSFAQTLILALKARGL